MADNLGHLGRLDDFDVDAAIVEIASGTLTKDIAQRYGVSKVAVRKKMASHPDYEAAVEQQCENLLQRAAEPYFDEEQFKGLSDTVIIARTRDRMRAAEVYAKVICPNRFNAKAANVNVINNITTVDDTLGLQAAGLLDQLKTVSVQPAIAPQHIASQQDELVDDNPESRT